MSAATSKEVQASTLLSALGGSSDHSTDIWDPYVIHSTGKLIHFLGIGNLAGEPSIP